MPETLTAGSRVGSYEVIDRLGAGGMGEVYRARDVRLGRVVALKVLRYGANPELLHRLDREARAASALNHPNIVQIYDVGEAAGQEGAHFVVMEYVEGETLRRRLAPGPLGLHELLDLASQLTDGLARAHRAGIVHRDLKPENLMVTPEGRLKILDFGLAKRVSTPLDDAEVAEGETMSRHATQAGMLLGTLEYMSPEQAKGAPLDHRTDQFSVGLILHEMATGRPPFRRDTPAQVLAAVIERDPEPLRRLRPDVPEPLEALVARCLQKDPARRFARTDELAADLAALAGRSRAGTLAVAAVLPPPLPSAGFGAGARPVSAEVVPSPAPRREPAVYHVQEGDRVRSYDERKLHDRLRRGKLSGLELVRIDDEEAWQPLFKSRVYAQAVPNAGDPLGSAGRRALRAMAGHLTGFAITGIVMYSTQGHLPWWMGIWAMVLGMQTLGTVGRVLPILRGRRLRDQLAAAAAGPPVLAVPPALPGAPASPASAPSSIAQEAARVRALIEQRKGSDHKQLLAEVDGILKLSNEAAARQADLEEQTSPEERAALAASVAAARVRLETAELQQDKRLFERQLAVLEGRQEAIAKAMRVLERLRVRRDLAEHQLKQLRLDLTRGAAGGLDVPTLSSRLEFIRDEVDAREEVAEIGAERS